LIEIGVPLLKKVLEDRPGSGGVSSSLEQRLAGIESRLGSLDSRLRKLEKGGATPPGAKPFDPKEHPGTGGPFGTSSVGGQPQTAEDLRATAQRSLDTLEEGYLRAEEQYSKETDRYKKSGAGRRTADYLKEMEKFLKAHGRLKE